MDFSISYTQLNVREEKFVSDILLNQEWNAEVVGGGCLIMCNKLTS